MPNKTDKDHLGSNNPKWVAESKKIRNIQISLDFVSDVDVAIRLAAARRAVPPSSLVREMLGFKSRTPQRTRIGVSFNNDELAILGKRFGIDPSDKAAIKRKVTELVSESFAEEAKAVEKHHDGASDVIAALNKVSQEFITKLGDVINKAEGKEK